MTQETITFSLDSAVVNWLKENLTEFTPGNLASTLVEAHVASKGGPHPAKHQVSKNEFVFSGLLAIAHNKPVDEVVKVRKEFVAEAVSRAFEECGSDAWGGS